MRPLKTIQFEITGRVARIVLNRPSRGNGITMDMPQELAWCVEQANINPQVHVIALSGNGSGFCGGYDLVESAQAQGNIGEINEERPSGSTLDPLVQMQNHIRAMRGIPCWITP